MQQELSGPFKTYVPNGYHSQAKKVLYIGKATDGDYDEAEAAEVFKNKNSAFWYFARNLSRLGGGDNEYSNLAWSNIFKQGVTEGNPRGTAAEAQRESAVAELKREVEELRPDLIVLVTTGYYEEIPKLAFDIRRGDAESDVKEHVVDNERFSIWSRTKHGSLPPIIWINHPQGKTKVYTQAALDEASRLTGWTAVSPDMQEK